MVSNAQSTGKVISGSVDSGESDSPAGSVPPSCPMYRRHGLIVIMNLSKQVGPKDPRMHVYAYIYIYSE